MKLHVKQNKLQKILNNKKNPCCFCNTNYARGLF